MDGRIGRVVILDEATPGRQAICRALLLAGFAVYAETLDDHVGDLDLGTFEPDVVVARLGNSIEPVLSVLSRNPLASVVLLVAPHVPAQTRVEARSSGADELFTEPFDVDELVAGVELLVRRRTRRVIEVLDLSIDQDAHLVERGRAEVKLTATEYRLLVHLASNAGQVVTKRQLLERVWGFDGYDANLVEVHVSSLRRKLEAHGVRVIHTVRGFGYVIRSARSPCSSRDGDRSPSDDEPDRSPSLSAPDLPRDPNDRPG